MEQVSRQHATCGPDSQLLERFAARRDEAAFRELVERHGPMVHGVCRRVLRHAHDAEDAFQATFIVLARRAGAIRKQDAVGSWLYGVAYRVATRLKCASGMQRERERQAGQLAQAAQGDLLAAIVWQELRPVLDEELHQLPEKYRAPLVLCYLEGKTHDQAARELGWSKGSMSRRMDKARELLRGRLCQRGITLSTGVIFGVLAHNAASAAVPTGLVQPTAQAAVTVAAGSATAGVVSTQVVALAEGVLQTMLVTKLKLVAGLAAAVLILGSGGGLATYQALAQDDQAAQGKPAKPAVGTATGTPAKIAAAPASDSDAAAKPLAAGASIHDRPPLSTSDVRQRLHKPTDRLRQGIDPGTPLREALDFLGKSHNLNFRIDYAAFAKLGSPQQVVDDTKVSFRATPEVTLAVTLRELLGEADPAGTGAPSVTYVIRGKDLVIVPAQQVLANNDAPVDAGTTAVGALREPVQIHAEDKPLGEALRELADATGTNIIVDVRLKEKAKVPVTAILNHVPLDTAVKLLADMAEVKAVAVDNVLYVTSRENGEKLEKEHWEKANGVYAPSGSLQGIQGGGLGGGLVPQVAPTGATEAAPTKPAPAVKPPQ